MVDGAEFWISCKRPAFLSSFSRLQVVQNSAPMWHPKKEISTLKVLLYKIDFLRTDTMREADF